VSDLQDGLQRRLTHRLNQERKTEDLLLKIGIHEGPCLAVMENGRQDYFGRAVNVAARVQNLAVSREICATGASFLRDPSAYSERGKKYRRRSIIVECLFYPWFFGGLAMTLFLLNR
jgi:class 3 adenylate cyclase